MWEWEGVVRLVDIRRDRVDREVGWKVVARWEDEADDVEGSGWRHREIGLP